MYLSGYALLYTSKGDINLFHLFILSHFFAVAA